MSLGGQWVGRYQGTNSGLAVIDIDELEDCFVGTAVGWEADTTKPSSMVQFRTDSKGPSHTITGLDIAHVNNSGNPISREIIQQFAQQGYNLPQRADITFNLAGQDLHIRWSSSIGTHGEGVAHAFKTRAGNRSEMPVSRVRGWDSFKRAVNKLPKKRYIFRGQEDHAWRLRTSFHRTGRANLSRYNDHDLNELNRIFSASIPQLFNVSDGRHFTSLIALAQHHGYPTPLLDWTWSPYVAAFFAYRNIHKVGQNSRKKVRIYKLDSTEWNKLVRADKIFLCQPNITVLDPLPIGNPRAIPQQALSSFSNVDDMEGHFVGAGKVRQKTYLEAFDLPASERQHVMDELALMGITAGALFPGLDGACEALRERNFFQRA